jgi:hypothetical protein
MTAGGEADLALERAREESGGRDNRLLLILGLQPFMTNSHIYARNFRLCQAIRGAGRFLVACTLIGAGDLCFRRDVLRNWKIQLFSIGSTWQIEAIIERNKVKD